jgi:hypothetical protein
MLVVTPDDLKDYLTNPDVTEMQDCFKSGKVPADPVPAPEQQVIQVPPSKAAPKKPAAVSDGDEVMVL